MIISDKHKFVFIHIPKCAGSSLRAFLKPFDEKTIPNSLHEHIHFGQLDYAHIPLLILKDNFKTEYDKVRDYFSFAIMRDPFSRFPSALRQRLGFHQNRKIHTMSKKEIRDEVDKSINLLEKHANDIMLPAELIHFQKQKSYIFCGDVRILDAVYDINNIAGMFSELEKKLGLKFSGDALSVKVNKSPMVYKNDLLRQLDQSTRMYRTIIFKFIPLGVKKALKKNFVVQPKDLEIFNSSYVKSFIESFYKEDIKLYNDLIGNSKNF